MKEITIYDIAKKLDLSASTVSRALKDNPVINETTRRRVREYAEHAGYRSNAFARNLRTQKTRTLGVIVPRLDSDFMSSCLAGMEEVANEQGYDLLITQSQESLKKEEENSTVLFNKRVDGLLVSLSNQEGQLGHFERFEEKNVPVVYFDRIPDSCARACFGIENEAMAYKATRHLLEQGCQKLAHLSIRSHLGVYHDRTAGFRRALDESPGADGKLVFLDDLSLEDGRAVAGRIIEQGFDGVFAANDQVATGCLLELQALGRAIPEDIAIVGFNNDQVSTIVSPALSTIEYPGAELGRKAMNKLLAALDGRLRQIDNTKLKTDLIIRGSSKRK